MEDLQFMDAALALAKEAGAEGEVPVGCVIVRKGQIVGRGRNRRETEKTALGHAEIEAIDMACRALHGWRLIGCTMYVTLEPCPMCAGALINARLGRVVYGAKDAKAGACGSVLNLDAYPLNHRLRAQGGVLARECAQVLSDFFENKRNRNPKELEIESKEEYHE